MNDTSKQTVDKFTDKTSNIRGISKSNASEIGKQLGFSEPAFFSK